MQSCQTYRFKLPVLNWLFLAFLSSCISYHTNDSQSARQLAKVEVVDSFTGDFKVTRTVNYYSGISFPVFQSKSGYFLFEKIHLLSQNLGDLAVTTARFLRYRSLPWNIFLHARIRNLHSNTCEDHIS